MIFSQDHERVHLWRQSVQIYIQIKALLMILFSKKKIVFVCFCATSKNVGSARVRFTHTQQFYFLARKLLFLIKEYDVQTDSPFVFLRKRKLYHV
jgi:hypothetical protein